MRLALASRCRWPGMMCPEGSPRGRLRLRPALPAGAQGAVRAATMASAPPGSGGILSGRGTPPVPGAAAACDPGGMTYPATAQVVVGTRTLMIALAAGLEQSTQSGRLPEVPGSANAASWRCHSPGRAPWSSLTWKVPTCTRSGSGARPRTPLRGAGGQSWGFLTAPIPMAAVAADQAPQRSCSSAQPWQSRPPGSPVRGPVRGRRR